MGVDGESSPAIDVDRAASAFNQPVSAGRRFAIDPGGAPPIASCGLHLASGKKDRL